MAETKSCMMNSRGSMYTSRASDEDQMTIVIRRFFFTRQRDEISTLHRESNGYDLKALIRILALIEDEEKNQMARLGKDILRCFE